MRDRRKSIGGIPATSAPVQTAATPAVRRARLVSICLIRPAATVERTTRMWSWSKNRISSPNRPSPRSSGPSSMRRTLCPMMVIDSRGIPRGGADQDFQPRQSVRGSVPDQLGPRQSHRPCGRPNSLVFCRRTVSIIRPLSRLGRTYRCPVIVFEAWFRRRPTTSSGMPASTPTVAKVWRILTPILAYRP